jgi:hypothetical protein
MFDHRVLQDVQYMYCSVLHEHTPYGREVILHAAAEVSLPLYHNTMGFIC